MAHEEKERDAFGRFGAFVEDQLGESNLLPLTHVTRAYSFRDIIGGDALYPQPCKYFGENLIYLYYGRPAYRVSDAVISDLTFNWPVLLIFKPEGLRAIKRVFPFDSGAFIDRLYSDIFSHSSPIAEFQLPGTLKSAQKIVDAFYGDENAYYRGKSDKRLKPGNLDFEIQGVERLATEPGRQVSRTGKRVDERSSAVEVQVSEKIDLQNHLLAIVLPEEFISIPAITQAISRWGVAERVHTYTAVMGLGPEAWPGMLYNIVKKIYIENDYITLDAG